jgi:hypothetical protein
MTHLLLPTLIASSLDAWLSSPLVILFFALAAAARAALELASTASLPLEAPSCAWAATRGRGRQRSPATGNVNTFHAADANARN